MQIIWEVIHGDHLGRKIGFPTANIEFFDENLKNATFFVTAILDGHHFPAAGIYMPHKGAFEVHILDFDADIYGQILKVDIVDKIRDNRRFESLEELKKQIEKDILFIREKLEDNEITR